MNRPRPKFATAIGALSLALIQPDAFADELQAQSQNPVASLVSLPIESSANFEAGPSDENAYSTLIKPVYPAKLSENWNLINRFIAPVIYLEGQDAVGAPDASFELGGSEVFPGSSSEFGLGNLQYQAFFSPARPGKLIWGFGPAFELPTNTDKKLGSDTWSAGFSAVGLTIQGSWVVGLLLQNIWDIYSESGEPDVNRATVQPILNYNLDNGWYLSATTTIGANWEADSGNEWTVPLGGGAGRLVRFGKQPVDFKLMAFSNVEKPKFGPEWSIQFTVKFLFPKS